MRRVWMVLDGSKEASLPSCGDKPSLALQQRVTHSIAQWRILGRIVFFFRKDFVILRGVPSPHQAVQVNKSNATPSSFFFFGVLHSVTLRLPVGLFFFFCPGIFAHRMYRTLSNL